MKMKFTLFVLTAVFFIGCENKTKKNSESNYEKVLVEKENDAAQNELEIEGKQISKISFEVTANKKDFEDGIRPWVSIEKPESDLPNLINKSEIVISDKKITVIIDYPLTNEYRFDLISEKGFTREMLLVEISKHYYKLYAEEEKSATVKTVPADKREMYNRNETNGKYGVWGHDIGDLLLTDIQVYKDSDEKVTLVLGIDS